MNRKLTGMDKVYVFVGLAGAGVLFTGGADDPLSSGPSTGEVLTLLGFLLTCATILWRGGRLEGVLNRLERDVAAMSNDKAEMASFRRETESDRAKINAQVAEINRRMESIESRIGRPHE